MTRSEGELAEDVYRIVAEAIHNVVRHAAAGKVTIRLSLRGGRLTGDRRRRRPGHGAGRARAHDRRDAGQRDPGQRGPAAGYGLTTMRERAERWGGTVTVGPGRSSGTVVRLAVPLDGGIPLAPGRAPGAPGGAP